MHVRKYINNMVSLFTSFKLLVIYNIVHTQGNLDHHKKWVILYLDVDENLDFTNVERIFFFWWIEDCYKHISTYSTESTIHRYPVPIVCRSFVESTRCFRSIICNAYLDIMQSVSYIEYLKTVYYIILPWWKIYQAFNSI